MRTPRGLRLAALCLFTGALARAQRPGTTQESLVNASEGTVERVFNLEDAQRLAQLNDPKMLSAEQDTIIAQERVKEARFQFFPDIGLQASATKFESRYPFSLSGDFRNILLFPGTPQNIYSSRGYFHMSLYEGRRHIDTLELTKTAHKAALSNYESVKRDVLLSSKDAFYRLILAQEKLAAAENNEIVVAESAASPRLDAWEKVEAESLLGEARVQTAESRHELDSRKLAFLKSLNLELDTTFRVVGTLKSSASSVDTEKAVLWAMELRPELQSETYKAQMDAISVNLAFNRRNPTLFLAGDYELTGQRFPLRQNNWASTIGIKIPFSYDYWSQIKQKRAEQRQGELKRAELQDRVRLEVRQAYENMQYWQKEWPERTAHYLKVKALYDEASQAAGGALAKARATSSLTRLHLAALAAVTEHILAQAKLEWAVGRELTR